MCKVAIIPAIKKDKQHLAVKLIKALGTSMSVGNNDGLGYAAIDSTGNLFGERWWINSTAFQNSAPQDSDLASSLFPGYAKVKQATNVHVIHNSFGDGTLEDVVAITLHTRFATSGKGFENTHPFVEDDTSLIHNGVISNTDDFKFTLSTCDSEAILKSYLKHNVGSDIKSVQSMASDLYGYYVAALFARDSVGNRVLDVIKGNNDALVCAWIKELDTYVFCSSEITLSTACKEAGVTMGTACEFLDGIAMRIDPYSGAMLEGTSFNPNLRSKPVVPTYNNNYYNSFKNTPAIPMKSHTHKARRNLSRAEIEYMKLPIKITKSVGNWNGWEYTGYRGE